MAAEVVVVVNSRIVREKEFGFKDEIIFNGAQLFRMLEEKLKKMGKFTCKEEGVNVCIFYVTAHKDEVKYRYSVKKGLQRVDMGKSRNNSDSDPDSDVPRKGKSRK